MLSFSHLANINLCKKLCVEHIFVNVVKGLFATKQVSPKLSVSATASHELQLSLWSWNFQKLLALVRPLWYSYQLLGLPHYNCSFQFPAQLPMPFFLLLRYILQFHPTLLRCFFLSWITGTLSHSHHRMRAGSKALGLSLVTFFG